MLYLIYLMRSFLGRTTEEHESLLRHLDNLLVLGYLYESERTRNPDLEQLKNLATEIAYEARVSTNASMFRSDIEMRQVICGVMNVLQSACQKGNLAPVTAVDSAWDGLPAVLGSPELWRIHAEHQEDLAKVFVTLLSRLDTMFSSEVKPSVTRELVAAIFRALRHEGCIDFVGPIQVEVLSTLAHQELLAALNRHQKPLAKPGHVQMLVTEYARQANQSFQRMVEFVFIQNTVAKLYPRARRLHLLIDRAYPWGGLWREPVSGRELLDLYARLNRSGAIRNSKYKPTKPPNDDTPGLSLEEFSRFAINVVSHPKDIDHSDPVRQFFNSDDVDLHIDGNLVQKHAVMAICYSQPLSDVERAVRLFRNYLLFQRKSYCTNAGEALSFSEAALDRRLQREILGEAKSGRAIVQDMSSVLGLLCALIYLQMQRNPDYVGVLVKTQMLTIEEWVKAAGFEYTTEAIRKACARIPAVIEALRARFVGA